MTLDNNGTAPNAVLEFPQQSRTLGSVPPLVDEPLSLPVVAEPQQPTPVKQVAIVGFAPSSRDMVMGLPAGWDFWGLNQLFQVFPDVSRFTRWFELHDHEFFPQAWPPGYMEWLNGQKFPIVTPRRVPGLTNNEVYPLRRMVERFGVNGSLDKAAERSAPQAYFTNSIAMMIALAIDEGYGAIRVYGVDMLQETEYEIQRANCEAIIMYGRGMGIDIWIAPQCALLRASHVYGFEPIPQMGAIDVPFILGELGQLNARFEQATQETQLTLGAKMMAQRMLEMIRPRGADEPLIALLEKEVNDLQAKATNALAVTSQIEGAKLAYERMLEMSKHWRKFGVTPGFMDTGIVR